MCRCAGRLAHVLRHSESTLNSVTGNWDSQWALWARLLPLWAPQPSRSLFPRPDSRSLLILSPARHTPIPLSTGLASWNLSS